MARLFRHPTLPSETEQSPHEPSNSHRHLTADTAEPVTGPVFPADDRAGDGYDWMDTLENTVWSALPAW